MYVVSRDVSLGKGRQRYNRTVFQCLREDIWMTMETPVEDEA